MVAKVQANDPAYSPFLDDAATNRIQEIVRGLLFYAHAVDNKLLVELSDIGTQQTDATKQNNEAISQLLD